MEIKRFGNSHASLYELSNEKGMKLVLTDIGASIVSIIVPDSFDRPVDVALGYDRPEDYLTNASTFGAVVGRYANRIGKAQFELDGKKYALDVNDNSNCLHGGFDKWYHRIWYAEANPRANSVTFLMNSPDLDQGMPGNAKIAVTYTLNQDKSFSIAYQAISDKDTYFNLTNHCYFNLDGEGNESISDHELWLNASQVTAVDDELIPTGEILNISGTPLDFQKSKKIGLDINSDYAPIQLAGGFDHNYILNESEGEPFAKVSSARSGIAMEVYTDLPAVQLYTGNFLGKDKNGKNSHSYGHRSGFCLETQFYPDSPNHPDFPDCLSKAGELFTTSTTYSFSLI